MHITEGHPRHQVRWQKKSKSLFWPFYVYLMDCNTHSRTCRIYLPKYIPTKYIERFVPYFPSHCVDKVGYTDGRTERRTVTDNDNTPCGLRGVGVKPAKVMNMNRHKKCLIVKKHIFEKIRLHQCSITQCSM